MYRNWRHNRTAISKGDKLTAEKIRQERKNRKLTQVQFSKIIGFPLRTLQKWEGSERTMSKWSDHDVKEALEEYDKSIKDPTKDM